MKKAAVILIMSSTAFAAPRAHRPTVAMTPAQQTTAIAQTLTQANTSVAGPQAAPQAAKPRQAKAKQAKATRVVRTVGPQARKTTTPVSSDINDRTQSQPSPQAGTDDYVNALAKRRPSKSLTTTTESDPGIKAPTFGDFQLKAQLRNTMTMANGEELQNVGGRNYQLTNEVRLGIKHTSGFGLGATGTYQSADFADPRSNVGTPKDATLMVYHPSLFKNNTVDVSGYFRMALPTSESSRDGNVYNYTYWSFVDITLPAKWSISQTAAARYYTRNKEEDTKLNSMLFEELDFLHQTSKSIALGFGGQFESDNMYGSASTMEADIYPYADFTFIPNVLIEPKFYFPVFVRGTADNSPNGVSGAALNQGWAELFIKIAI